MVKRDNTSLFNKIMGSVSAPAAQDIEEDEDGIMEEEEYEEVLVEDEDDAEDGVVIEKPVSQNITNDQAAQSQSSWMADHEGQLNIDMYQTKDNVILKSTVAGVRPEDLDITVANDIVTVRGSRKREEDVSQDDYFYQECYWGSFSRSVIVPVDIDSEHIEADLKDGILTVVIPKAAKAKTKKVKVRGL